MPADPLDAAAGRSRHRLADDRRRRLRPFSGARRFRRLPRRRERRLHRQAAGPRAISNPMAVDDTFGHGTRVATHRRRAGNGKGTVGVSPNSQLIVVQFTTDSQLQPRLRVQLSRGNRTERPAARREPVVHDRRPARRQVAARRADPGGRAGGGGIRQLRPLRPVAGERVRTCSRSDAATATRLGNSAGGPRLDLVAPGEPDAARRRDHGKCHTISTEAGTSFAAPMVAGVAARVWGTFDEVVDPQVIAYLLRKKASRKGVLTGRQGFGLVDLTAATRCGRRRCRPPTRRSRTTARPRPTKSRAVPHGVQAARHSSSSSDDNFDYWRLARRRCPRGKIRSLNHARVGVGCFRVHGARVRQGQRPQELARGLHDRRPAPIAISPRADRRSARSRHRACRSARGRTTS